LFPSRQGECQLAAVCETLGVNTIRFKGLFVDPADNRVFEKATRIAVSGIGELITKLNACIDEH
jgi:hypothetical protein